MHENIDYDKLQDALETIKNVCETSNQKGCSNCPLGDKFGTCRLMTRPDLWVPRHPDTHAFRVLE